jgi:hypothetical protein
MNSKIIVPEHCFNNQDGIGSRWHCLSGIWRRRKNYEDFRSAVKTDKKVNSRRAVEEYTRSSAPSVEVEVIGGNGLIRFEVTAAENVVNVIGPPELSWSWFDGVDCICPFLFCIICHLTWYVFFSTDNHANSRSFSWKVSRSNDIICLGILLVSFSSRLIT